MYSQNCASSFDFRVDELNKIKDSHNIIACRNHNKHSRIEELKKTPLEMRIELNPHPHTGRHAHH